LKYCKHMLILTTILLSFALAGCGGKMIASGNNEIPEVPLEELTNKYEKGIYQEVEEDSRRVINFADKAQWVRHMSEIMDGDLAQSYADEFFYEKEDGLYLLSRGGPFMLILDQPYELKKIDETKVQVTQISENVMTGKYELTVTYEYRDGRWIIQNQEFNIIEKEKVSYTPEEAEEIISDRVEKVLNLIAGRDMKALIEYVHPVKGVRFSPYSYVDLENSVVFMPSDFEEFFSSSTEYNWGSYDGTGEPITLTPAAYYDIFIYDQDFRNAERISYNKQLFQGNMINNAPDVYPGSMFVPSLIQCK
jgi:uncharacterized lipoprotein YehR (DUF1307 family)